MYKQMKNNKGKLLISRLAVMTLAALMVLGSAMATFAATKDGEGGKAYAGPEVNTFAAGMPLTEIYLDKSKFMLGVNPELQITDNTSKALEIYENGIVILGSALSHNTLDNNIKGQYKATYKNAAIMPDGTTKDVVLTADIGRVMTARAGEPNIFERTFVFNNPGHAGDGINVTTTSPGTTTGVDETRFAIAVQQTITIDIVDGSGDFIVPINGINQNRNSAGNFAVLNGVHGREGYEAAIESVIAPDSNVFYPKNDDDPDKRAYYSTGGGDFILRGGSEALYKPDPPYTTGGSSSVVGDELYPAGFATIGENASFTATFNEPSASNNTTNYSNNSYIALGDLIHRIWSGSGPNGKIETDKNGDTTGATLPGGSFTGDIPSGMPAANTDDQQLMRYVVPDAKKNVTYTMTPDAGYFAKEVSVDGKTIKIPMDPEPGKTWTFDAGVLTHVGGDKYIFVFNKPNADDHSIYVTWRTTPAADDATSIDGKGITQTGKPVFKAAEGHDFIPGEYTLIDDEGNPVDSITVPGEGKYTIDKETGVVTFVPEPDFVGTAKGVTVRATQNDDDHLTTTAQYIPTVVETEQTKTVSRDITFTYETEDGKTASKTVTQTLTFKRTGTYNKETGQVDYPDWEPQTFPAVKAPEISGWTPNMAAAPAQTVTDPDEDVKDVHVVYERIPYSVDYLDGDHGKSDGKGNQSGEDYGSDVTGGNGVTAAKGYHFTGKYTYVITDHNGKVIKTGETDDPKSLDVIGNIEFTPIYAPNRYTIKYDPNGGSGSMSDQHFTGADDTANSKENEFTRDGYKFAGFKAKLPNGKYLKDENGNDLIFMSVDDFIEYLHEQGDGGEITLEAQWIKDGAGSSGGVDTGDNTSIATWMTMLILAITCVAALLIRRKRHN